MRVFEAKNPKTGEPYKFEPHQLELAHSKHRLTYLSGGWGAGKSIGGIAFCQVSMMVNPGCIGFIIEPDYKMLLDFIESKFKPAFSEYITGESRAHFLYKIHMERGITVIGLSGHKLEKVEQYEGAWLFADEVALMKSDLLHRSIARTRENTARRLRVGFAGTPHYGWLYEAFMGTDAPDRRLIQARTSDNPHNPEDYEDDLRASCPAHMAAAYIEGRFVPPGGAVHPDFGDRNFIEWPEYNRKYDVGCVTDWGTRAPHVLYFQVLQPGDEHPEIGKVKDLSLVVFDELFQFPGDSFTTPQLCEYIKNKRFPLSVAIGDPAGEGVQSTSGTSDIRIARQALGLPIRYPDRKTFKDVRTGVEHVNLALAPLVGKPRLYFAKHLEKDRRARAVVNAMRALSYEKDQDGKPKSDKPMKDGTSDHATDCTRYLVCTLIPAFPRLIRKPPRSYI